MPESTRVHTPRIVRPQVRFRAQAEGRVTTASPRLLDKPHYLGLQAFCVNYTSGSKRFEILSCLSGSNLQAWRTSISTGKL